MSITAVPTIAARASTPAPATARVRIEPPRAWLELRLREVWMYRELLYFLVWRDLKVRYKQTVVGVAWVVLQPLMSMGGFHVIKGYQELRIGPRRDGLRLWNIHTEGTRQR